MGQVTVARAKGGRYMLKKNFAKLPDIVQSSVKKLVTNA